MPFAGELPRRCPEPFELLPSEMELPPELLDDDVDDVEDVPPEDDDPDEDDPDGTAVPDELAPAGAECCAFAAGATATAMMPIRLAATKERFMPSSTS